MSKAESRHSDAVLIKEVPEPLFCRLKVLRKPEKGITGASPDTSPHRPPKAPRKGPFKQFLTAMVKRPSQIDVRCVHVIRTAIYDSFFGHMVHVCSSPNSVYHQVDAERMSCANST